MDLKLIQKLIKLMKDGEVFELELEDEKAGSRLRLKRGRPEAPAAQMPLVHVMHGAPAAAALPLQPATAAGAAPAETPKPAAQKGVTINSPMVGTFYRSSSPESDPFVRVGSRIEVDKTLCIIEAMKLMNEIEADVAGTIVAIYPQNTQPVEFGEKLFAIQPR